MRKSRSTGKVAINALPKQSIKFPDDASFRRLSRHGPVEKKKNRQGDTGQYSIGRVCIAHIHEVPQIASTARRWELLGNDRCPTDIG
jgi:hypothetical protein